MTDQNVFSRVLRTALILLTLLLLAFVLRAAWLQSPDVPTPIFAADAPALGGVHESKAGAAVRAPLIVVVVIDTLRFDHVSASRFGTTLTPQIDDFARQSHQFGRAVASSSWTRSSVATLLTSRFPSSVGVLERGDELSTSVETLAETLKAEGYRTAAIVANGNVGIPFGFGQGFDAFVVPEMTESEAAEAEGKIIAPAVTRAALAQVALPEPLFLYVHYVDPHEPYLPHKGKLLVPEPAGRFSGSNNNLTQLDDAFRRGETNPIDLERIRYLYAGEVSYADEGVGRLFDGIRDLGRWQDALVVLTADHGEGLWDHRRRNHGADLHVEQTHVPLLMRLPGMSEGDGQSIDSAVSLVDVAPTVLAQLGIESPSTYEGFDLSPLFAGQSRPAALDWIYSELTLDRQNFESMQHGALKVIRGRRPTKVRDRLGLSVELYDLSEDPRETKDLAGPLFPSRNEAQLRRALDVWGDEITQRVQDSPELPWENLDPATRASLEALGYAEPVK